jgi:DNA-binding NarL/FixJ family response regulator
MMELDQWHELCRERITENVKRFGLSPRECEVAWLLFTLYTRADIGEELYVTNSTIKNHMSNIIRKLDLPQDKAFRSTVIVRLLDLEGLA